MVLMTIEGASNPTVFIFNTNVCSTSDSLSSLITYVNMTFNADAVKSSLSRIPRGKKGKAPLWALLLSPTDKKKLVQVVVVTMDCIDSTQRGPNLCGL